MRSSAWIERLPTVYVTLMGVCEYCLVGGETRGAAVVLLFFRLLAVLILGSFGEDTSASAQ